MDGYYITGTKGSYIELSDGRWADSVSYGTDRLLYPIVTELLAEMTTQTDFPLWTELSVEELKEYVGA